MRIDKKLNRKRAGIGLLALAVVVVCLLIVLAASLSQKKDKVKQVAVLATEPPETEGFIEEESEAPVPATTESEESLSEQYKEIVDRADALALSYDYERAIEMIQGIKGYKDDGELTEKIRTYEKERDNCQPVNIAEVTHVFYHSLVVDPERAFANQDTDPQAVGNNQWMTTVSEFEKILQEMYDRGYVIVGIHDLIQITTDENGAAVYQPGEIMLPKGKRAYVLSQDDLSYYHCYDNYGYAAKMVLDEKGKPVCEYIQPDGTRVTGDYDVVPLLDKFIEKHPDASYRGAKGLIALTGYNGILGYRTDNSYLYVNDSLNYDKKMWLENNPDFDIEKERAEAKKVADALKEDGWEFASHTWGHIKIRDSSLERLMSDTWKWHENVEPLVGKTDAIVFAHGQDLGDWGAYDEYNEKYQFLKGEGFHIFCNVDQGQYLVHFGRDYLRQGRRDLDGYRIYRNAVGIEDNLSDLFDASKIIDPLRPPVPSL